MSKGHEEQEKYQDSPSQQCIEYADRNAGGGSPGILFVIATPANPFCQNSCNDIEYPYWEGEKNACPPYPVFYRFSDATPKYCVENCIEIGKHDPEHHPKV